MFIVDFFIGSDCINAGEYKRLESAQKKFNELCDLILPLSRMVNSKKHEVLLYGSSSRNVYQVAIYKNGQKANDDRVTRRTEMHVNPEQYKNHRRWVGVNWSDWYKNRDKILKRRDEHLTKCKEMDTEA